jgi:hypothetical protein
MSHASEGKDRPMATSKAIAGLIGPGLVAMAASLLLNRSTLPALIEQASQDPGLVYVSGMLLFVAGVAILRAHNRWTVGWPVLVTALGWLILVGGLVRLLFPVQLGHLANEMGQRIIAIIALLMALLMVGAFLTFKGYRRE